MVAVDRPLQCGPVQYGRYTKEPPQGRANHEYLLPRPQLLETLQPEKIVLD